MPKTILIIEDEEHLVELLKFRLEAKGYNIETALDGEEGLRKAYEIKPDLILLDIMMPKVHGYEVCRSIRDNKDTKDTPIVILTARTKDSDMEQAAECGADSFITKPFEPEHLIAEIKKYLK